MIKKVIVQLTVQYRNLLNSCPDNFTILDSLIVTSNIGTNVF